MNASTHTGLKPRGLEQSPRFRQSATSASIQVAQSCLDADNMRRMDQAYQGPIFPVFDHEATLSTDSRFVTFRHELARRLADVAPVEIDSSGFSTTGFVGSPSILMSCTGVKMSRTNQPSPSFAGADAHPTEYERSVLTWLFRYMFGAPDFSVPYRHPRKSTTSPPHFRRDESFKLAMLAENLEKFELLRDTAERRDEARMWDLGYGCSFHLGERAQQDSAEWSEGRWHGKDRKVLMGVVPNPDWDDVRRTEVIADKQLHCKAFGLAPGRATAMRIRTMYMASGAANSLLNMMLGPFRASMYARGAFTWHHRGRAHLLDKANRYRFVIGSDVTQMDQRVPRSVSNLWCELWTAMVPAIGGLRRMFTYAPITAGPASAGTPGYVCGRPATANTERFYWGLPSGIADVAEFGKWYMTSVHLIVIGRAMGLGVQELCRRAPAILQGADPHVAILNAGDDNGTLVNDAGLQRSLQALYAEGGGTKLATISAEQGFSFLGEVAVRATDGAIGFVPNAFRSLANRYSPERHWTHPARLFPGEGILAARLALAAHPSFGLIKQLEDEIWQDVMRIPSPDHMAEQDRMRRGAPEVRARSEADLVVMANPDAIHYKVDPNDVSSDVMDQLALTIPADVMRTHVYGRLNYKGV